MKQFAKQWLTDLLAAAGYEIRRNTPKPTGELASIAFKLFQLQNPNDLVLQVGASEGHFNDPIAELLLTGPNPALLVEPDPSNFAALEARYRNSPRIEVVNAAIGDIDGSTLLYTIKREGRWLESPHASQLSSFSRNHLLLHGVLENEIKTLSVPSLRVSTVLAAQSPRHLGFVMCDTEGYDRQVVEQILDIDLMPTFICFEFIHIMNDLSLLCQRLKERGYLILFDKQNCLAHKSDLLGFAA